MSSKIKPVILTNKKDNFYSYTNRADTYLMFHTIDTEKNDGLVKGNKTLFTNFYFKCKDQIIYSSDAAITQLYPSFYILNFTKFNISLTCILPENKDHLLIKIDNYKKKKFDFVLMDNEHIKDSINITDKKEYLLLSWSNVSAEESKIFSKTTSSYFKTQFNNCRQYTKEITQHFDFAFDDCKDNETTQALFWAQNSGHMLITGSEDQRGIWAGLPWFRDNWGRDTFISLPGLLLVNGYFKEAFNILKAFASYQNKDTTSENYGRIPNRYVKDGEMIYNTADGNLWFVKSLWQYLQYTGDKESLAYLWPAAQLAVQSDLQLRCDDKGFLINHDSDTWMDARINGQEPLSPRGNRANDIQSLWFETLNIFVKLSNLMACDNLVDKAQEIINKLKTNFTKYFWNEKTQQLADCIHDDDSADYCVRPNQLFCVNAQPQLLSDEINKSLTQSSFTKLCMPYGVLSLSADDKNFHPYHDGCPLYHKDAAYHNGAIWLWLSGPMVTALTSNNLQNVAYSHTKNLTHQIFNSGCTSTLSENANAALDLHDNFTPTGTWSQAWSIAEYVRNFYQDYLGIQPQLMQNKIQFIPHIPEEWSSGHAVIYVAKSKLLVKWGSVQNRDNKSTTRKFTFVPSKDFNNNIKLSYYDGKKFNDVQLVSRKKIKLQLTINSSEEKLDFVQLKNIQEYECMKQQDYLFNKITEEYKNKKIYSVK